MRAVDVGGQATAADRQAAILHQALVAGSNLLAVPLDVPDWSPASLFQGIPWSTVRTYDASSGWVTWNSRGPSSLPLPSGTRAAWVTLTADGDWTLTGLVPGPRSVALRTGWNLVGYDGWGGATTVATLQASTGAARVEGFSAAVLPYHLRLVDGGEALLPGQAYWLYVPQDATWVMT